MVDVWSCKLCDFGLSKFMFKSKGDHREAPRGAPQYRAPELIEGHWDLLSEKADVYR
jgi:serine/threonine protein kinase